MTSLREFVARAIEKDQAEGGAGILTDEEVKALEWAIMAPLSGAPAFVIAQHEQEGQKHRNVLTALAAELGPTRMFIHVHGRPPRTDAYWMHCADVAIEAYDHWLTERQKATP